MGSGVPPMLSSPDNSMENCHKIKKLYIDEIIFDQAARLISTTRLNTLLCVHLWPINPVIYWKPYVLIIQEGNLILWRVSRLYAFSAYPVRT